LDPGGERTGGILQQVGNLRQLETLLISTPFRVGATPLLPIIVKSCTRLASLSVKVFKAYFKAHFRLENCEL
jgi:hypothetical protein